MQINHVVFNSSVWGEKYRAKLAENHIATAVSDAAVADFVHQMQEIIVKHAQKVGADSESAAQGFMAKTNEILKIMKDRFALLKSEWGRWSGESGVIRFENADVQKSFDDLSTRLSQS
jgi:hypothetical protein